VVDYVSKLGSGQRAKGGSTITQQVAKNVLLGDEYSVTRKLKEMIVARRIEATLNKRQILELYLNEIPLGRQSFGVQAASRAYFNKDVGELQLHEVAFLAILPKAPERYGRAKHAALAFERRNYVLDQMVDNGWATPAQAAAAKARPLGLAPNRTTTYSRAVGYFTEEVRRRLIEQYGENAEDGPNSVYAGGLWVRTSLDLKMQEAARDALRAGLLRYHGGQGWKGPDRSSRPRSRRLAIADGAGQQVDRLRRSGAIGVILASDGSNGRIGFADGETAALSNIPSAARVGDLVAAAPVNSSSYAVRTIPEVGGGMVVMEPQTGRVIAVQGGFDSGIDSFNRGIQAMRQPGSTIKPFVYATGLDSGMTPATQILDGRFCVFQSASLGQKCFSNFGGGGGSGNHTMRWGLEQSRNLMTVRIANDAGMDRVVKTIKSVGIGEYKPYLAFSLGAGDTTVLRMVNAYSALANHGVQYAPSLIDYVQDRKGKVIWKSDKRRCARCNMAKWDGKPMPRIARTGQQVMDARTAFQTMHMLTGVIIRGTATTLNDLEPAAVRQDRHDQRPARRLVRRRLAAICRRCLSRLRQAALARRLCPGRADRRADLQGTGAENEDPVGTAALRGPGRNPHGPDRPHLGQAGHGRRAGRRREKLDHLGGVQAEHRAAALDQGRRLRRQARCADCADSRQPGRASSEIGRRGRRQARRSEGFRGRAGRSLLSRRRTTERG
jgi:penicillin-binding protein 1A